MQQWHKPQPSSEHQKIISHAMHSIKQHSNCRHPQQVGRDYTAHQMASQLDPPTEVHKHSEQTPSWTRPSSTLLGSSKSTTNRPRSLWTHDAEDGTSRRCSMQLWWSQADDRTLPRHKVLWWLSCLGQGSNRLVAQTEHWYIKLSSSNRIRTNERIDVYSIVRYSFVQNALPFPRLFLSSRIASEYNWRSSHSMSFYWSRPLSVRYF